MNHSCDDKNKPAVRLSYYQAEVVTCGELGRFTDVPMARRATSGDSRVQAERTWHQAYQKYARNTCSMMEDMVGEDEETTRR